MKKESILVRRKDSEENRDIRSSKDLLKSCGFEIEKCRITKSSSKEYFIGCGCLNQIKENDVKNIVIDENLDDYQRYNLLKSTVPKYNLIDRFNLILKKFKKNSSSKESKLQINLMELKYLDSIVEHIEKNNDEKLKKYLREVYGFSTREHLRKKIKKSNKRIEEHNKKIDNKYERRRKRGFSNVIIIGHTNSGKSSLLRRLSDNHTYDENEDKHKDISKFAKSKKNPFTTLNPTIRKINYDSRNILISDTIGFIRDLPDKIIKSMKIEANKIKNSDLAILLLDISLNEGEIKKRKNFIHKTLNRHFEAPRIITVYNKIDKDINIQTSKTKISTKENKNIEGLKEKIDNELPQLERTKIELPNNEKSMSLISKIHENCRLINKQYGDKSIIVEFEGKKELVSSLNQKT